MNIRLHKKSSVWMMFEDKSKLGLDAASRSPTGFYYILGWMIHCVLVYDGQATLDKIISDEQAKVSLMGTEKCRP